MSKPTKRPFKPSQSQATGLPELRLAAALSSRLAAGHPWVYRNQVPHDFHAADGAWVRLRSQDFSGFGVWDAASQVAVRVFSRKALPTQAWVQERVTEAWQLRRQLVQSGVTGFRLLYGEGDGVPGIVVDYYAGYCVLVAYSASLSEVARWVAQAVIRLEGVRGVVQRGSQGSLEVLAGHAPPKSLVVREGQYQLAVDLATGQKTGLFLDHRDNRHTVLRHAAGARVLNLFCYTGAFSLAALAGGATHVTSVDSAAPSVAAARDNFSLNGYDPEAHTFEVCDVFEYLERARQQSLTFDMVISDPPSFAKRREQVGKALKAYRRLSVLGIRATALGGLYIAASCTSQVSPEQFQRMLAEAAQRSNRRLQLVHDAAHAWDHPMFIAHPEGRYLKCLVTRVLAPC